MQRGSLATLYNHYENRGELRPLSGYFPIAPLWRLKLIKKARKERRSALTRLGPVEMRGNLRVVFPIPGSAIGPEKTTVGEEVVKG
jgi:hypothetical protein